MEHADLKPLKLKEIVGLGRSPSLRQTPVSAPPQKSQQDPNNRGQQSADATSGQKRHLVGPGNEPATLLHIPRSRRDDRVDGGGVGEEVGDAALDNGFQVGGRDTPCRPAPLRPAISIITLALPSGDEVMADMVAISPPVLLAWLGLRVIPSPSRRRPASRLGTTASDRTAPAPPGSRRAPAAFASHHFLTR